MNWDFENLEPGYFDVIVASPPCQVFYHANTGRPREMHDGDCLVLQTLRIIEHLRPKVWLLENPRTGDLVRRPYMQHIPYADFDYCEFAEWGYKKPTRIWGSPEILNVESVLCSGRRNNMAHPVEGQRPRHKQWLGAHVPQPSLNMKYRIPERLVEY